MITEDDLFSLLLNLSEIRQLKKCEQSFIEKLSEAFKGLNFSIAPRREPGAAWYCPFKVKNQIKGYFNVFGRYEALTEKEKKQLITSIRLFAIILENRTQARLLAEQNAIPMEKVKENESMMNNIANTAPLLIYIFDIISQKNVYANEKVYQTLGYSREKITYVKNFLDRITYPDDLTRIQAHYQDLLSSPLGEVKEIRYRIKDSSGRWHWFFSRDTPFKKNAQETTTHIISCAMDVTEKQEAEEEKEHLMNLLKSKNDELESIIYVASHDLRSPLVNIQGYASELDYFFKNFNMLLKQWGIQKYLETPEYMEIHEDMRDAINYINQSTVKIDMILKGLLHISRIGRAKPVIKETDMNAVLDQILGEMHFQIKQIEHTIHIEKLPTLQCDATLINQLFTNLIDNAIKYRKRDRPLNLTIRGKHQGKKVIYQIIDTGKGIAPNLTQKVFEIFQRVDEDQSISGQGLGLTIVKRIMNIHNGQIQLESCPGEGTTITLTFPVKDISIPV